MSTKYLSLFTGIGGFEVGIERALSYAECVGYSEIDKYAVLTYEEHYEHQNYGDITTIKPARLPDFDLVVGGFPCQAFSVAGKRLGFNETRGTLFFDVARIFSEKRPRHLVLENVKGLLSHDSGKTFQVILGVLADLGYRVEWQVLNSKNFGVPQNRERVYIVGHFGGECARKIFPITRAVESDIKVYGELNSETWAKRHDTIRRVHSIDGISPTIPTGTGGGVMNKIVTGQPRYGDGKQSVEYRVSDETPTIRATQHKSGDNQPKVLIREATKKGYAEAGIGDSINTQQPNSKTRRGRVGRGVANTLDTSMHQAVPVLTPDRLVKRQNARRFKTDGEPMFTVNTQDRHGIYDGVKIRRLTPTECERLQGFPDGWTIGSDTQRYKQCGNAVTTNVVEAVMMALRQEGCL